MKLRSCLLLGCLAVCQPSLAQPIIPDGTTTLPDDAFYGRADLTNVVIPDSVTNIGRWAFADCTNLTYITVGKGLATIGEGAFTCMAYTDWYHNPGGFPLSNAVSVCFTGNAPINVDAHAFDTWTVVGSSGAYVPCNVTVYYLSGTTGWGPNLRDRPAVCWNARITSAKKTAKGFSGFITGDTNLNACIYASTNLANQNWQRIRASVSLAGGPAYFEDNDSTNQTKFYKLGWSMPWNCVQTQIDDDNLHGGYGILSVNITPAAGDMLLAYVHSAYGAGDLSDGLNTWHEIGTVVCQAAAPNPPGTNSAGKLSLYYVPSCAGETVRITTSWPTFSLQVFEFSGGPWVLNSWSHGSQGYGTCCPPARLICPLTVITNGLDVAAIACLKGPCSPGGGWTSPGDFQGLVEWRKAIPNPNGYAEIINAASSDDYGAISASFIQQ